MAPIQVVRAATRADPPTRSGAGLREAKRQAAAAILFAFFARETQKDVIRLGMGGGMRHARALVVALALEYARAGGGSGGGDDLCQVVRVRGMPDPLSKSVDGMYKLEEDLYVKKPLYKMPSSGYAIYYSSDGDWNIGQSTGSVDNVFAYKTSEASDPLDIRGSWNVFTRDRKWAKGKLNITCPSAPAGHQEFTGTGSGNKPSSPRVPAANNTTQSAPEEGSPPPSNISKPSSRGRPRTRVRVNDGVGAVSSGGTTGSTSKAEGGDTVADGNRTVVVARNSTESSGTPVRKTTTKSVLNSSPASSETKPQPTFQKSQSPTTAPTLNPTAAPPPRTSNPSVAPPPPTPSPSTASPSAVPPTNPKSNDLEDLLDRLQGNNEEKTAPEDAAAGSGTDRGPWRGRHSRSKRETDPISSRSSTSSDGAPSGGSGDDINDKNDGDINDKNDDDRSSSATTTPPAPALFKMTVDTSPDLIGVSLRGLDPSQEYVVEYTATATGWNPSQMRRCCAALSGGAHACAAKGVQGCKTAPDGARSMRVEFDTTDVIPGVNYRFRAARAGTSGSVGYACAHRGCDSKFAILTQYPPEKGGVKLNLLLDDASASQSEADVRSALTSSVARLLSFDVNRIQLIEFTNGVAAVEIRPPPADDSDADMDASTSPLSGFLGERVRYLVDARGALGGIRVKKVLAVVPLHSCRDGILAEDCDAFEPRTSGEETVGSEATNYTPVLTVAILLAVALAIWYKRQQASGGGASVSRGPGDIELAEQRGPVGGGSGARGGEVVPGASAAVAVVTRVLIDMEIPRPPTRRYAKILNDAGIREISQLRSLSAAQWQRLGLPMGLRLAVLDEINGGGVGSSGGGGRTLAPRTPAKPSAATLGLSPAGAKAAVKSNPAPRADRKVQAPRGADGRVVTNAPVNAGSTKVTPLKPTPGRSRKKRTKKKKRLQVSELGDDSDAAANGGGAGAGGAGSDEGWPDLTLDGADDVGDVWDMEGDLEELQDLDKMVEMM